MCSHAGLANGANGSVRTWPVASSAGYCMYAFTATTRIPEASPLTATGMPVRKWARGERRSQPYKYSPRKIASMKNAKPSSVNAEPIVAPARCMNSGQRRPSSNDNAVPETAPTAKVSAVALAHWRASSL